MSNNKGFTLIELLVVMLILSSISLVAVAGISASLERQDENDCDNQKEIVINAAKIYFSLSDDPVIAATEGVTVEKLISANYFDEKDVDRLNNDYTITFNGSGYVISGECS